MNGFQLKDRNLKSRAAKNSSRGSLLLRKHLYDLPETGIENHSGQNQGQFVEDKTTSRQYYKEQKLHGAGVRDRPIHNRGHFLGGLFRTHAVQRLQLRAMLRTPVEEPVPRSQSGLSNDRAGYQKTRY